MRTAVVLVLLLAGCVRTTRPPVARLLTVPPDTAQECGNICQGIGLQLSAVVVVANSAGCVCEVQPRASSAVPGGASAASAGAVIVVEAERASDERLRKQRQDEEERLRKQRQDDEERRRRQQQPGAY
jgi:hypothetical protein